jgi:hypothetical protein
MLTMLVFAALTGCVPIQQPDSVPDHGLRAIGGVFVDLEDVHDAPDVVAAALAGEGACTVIFRADTPTATRMKPWVEAAKKRGLTVYAGLNYGNISPDDPVDALHALADADKATADALRSLPFDGWYIARETYNFDDDPRTIRTHYVDRLMPKLRDGRKVLVSPYFNPADDEYHQLRGPRATAELFFALFANSGITAVALQDRVAARVDPDSIGCSTWGEDEFLAQAAMYEREFVTKFTGSGTEPWINVESYEWSGGPATWSRLAKQLRIVPKQAAKIVTWHYSAFHGAPLHADYLRAVRPQACAQPRRRAVTHYHRER